MIDGFKYSLLHWLLIKLCYSLCALGKQILSKNSNRRLSSLFSCFFATTNISFHVFFLSLLTAPAFSFNLPIHFHLLTPNSSLILQPFGCNTQHYKGKIKLSPSSFSPSCPSLSIGTYPSPETKLVPSPAEGTM